MNITDTSWIVAGAEVLVYTPNTRDGRTDYRRTVIAKVATESFTVEATGELRFDLATQEWVSSGTYRHYVRRVVPLDSDEARQAVATAKRHQRIYEARVACAEYDTRPTRENRLAAIAALQAAKD